MELNVFDCVYSLLSLGKACNRMSALPTVLGEKAHRSVVPWDNCPLLLDATNSPSITNSPGTTAAQIIYKFYEEMLLF